MQSPKNNKNNKSISKKIGSSQTIKVSPTKIQEATKKPQTPKTPKNSQMTPQKRRHVTELSSIRNYDIEKQLQKSEKELCFKTEKVSDCISLFNLMQSNNMQLRCIHHNNILTLYCLTERKILCANCNYGQLKHRTHKIMPLKDSGTHICEDNTMLRDLLRKDLTFIEQSIKNCQQNSFIFENEMKKTLVNIEKQYTLKMDQLKSKYQSQMERVRKNFSSLIDRSRNLEKKIEQHKFKIWETISKIGTGKRSQSINNETQIVRQVVCSNMAEFTKFQLRKVTKIDIEKLLHRTRFS